MAQKLAVVLSLVVVASMIPVGIPLGSVGVSSPIGTASAAHPGTTVVVDASGPPDLDTIQEGINHASPGDEVFVKSGTYTETVVVNKSVTVFTNESVVLDGRGLDGPAFTVTNATSTDRLDDVAIGGFRIENYSIGIAARNEDALDDGPDLANVTILNNSIWNASQVGIALGYVDGEYENVTVVNNSVVSPNPYGSGILVFANGSTTANGTILAGNELDESNADFGILVQTFDDASLGNTTVVANNASTTGTGLGVESNDLSEVVYLNVSHNRFSETASESILVSGAGDSVTRDVTIVENALNESAGDGVVVEAVDANSAVEDVNVTGNLVSGSGSSALSLLADAGLIARVDIAENALNESGSDNVIVAARGGGTLEDVTLDTNNVSQAGGTGVVVGSEDPGTLVERIEIANALVNGSADDGLAAIADNGTVRDVTVRDSAVNNSGLDNVLLLADGTGTIEGVTLDTNDVRRSGDTGIEIEAVGTGATVRDVSITSTLAAGSTGDALRATADEGTIENVSAVENGFNGSADDGVSLHAIGNGAVEDVRLESINASDNSIGLRIEAEGSGIVDNVTATEVLASGNDQRAVSLVAGRPATGSDATIANVTFEEVGLNDTANGPGVRILSFDDSAVERLVIDTADLRNNTGGIEALALNDSTMTDLVVESALLGGGPDGGALLVAGRAGTADQASVDNVTFTEVGLNETGGTGLAVLALGDSEVRAIRLETADLGDNAIGLEVIADDTARVERIGLETVLVNGSAQNGLRFDARGSSMIRDVDLVEVAANETGTGSGIEFEANATAEITDLRLYRAITRGNPVGTLVAATESGTVTDVNVTNTLNLGNDQAGLAFVAGEMGGPSDTATIENGSVEVNAFNDTANGAGLAVVSWGDSELRNLSVFQNVFDGNEEGIRIGARETSRIEDVGIEQALVTNSDENGILLDGDAGGTHEDVGVRLSLLENNGQAGVNASPTTDVDGVTVHFAFIADNARGIDNRNGTGVLDARHNWWGNSTGPGSEPGPNAPYEDPVTEALANGTGDTVSEGATAGVSNVRFDPAIGGKTRCAGDAELTDPIPADTSLTVGGTTFESEINLTFAGQTISGELRNFVGLCLWERASLPLRADHTDAARKVRNPRVVLRTNLGDIQVAGAGSNREYTTVYGTDRPVSLDFRKVSPGADTTRFADEDVKLLVARAETNRILNTSASADPLAFVNVTFDETTGRLTAGSNLTALEAKPVGTLDSNGEITNVEFTPSAPGEYLVLLATVETGDGFDVDANGNFTFDVLNDSTTLIGAEVVLVHETNSTVAPAKPAVRPGERLRFDAQSNLASGNVSHAVIVYDKDEFENKLVIVNDTNSSSSFTGGALLATLTGFNDGAPFLVSVNVSTDGTINDITTSGAIDNVSSAVAIERFGGTTESLNVTIPVGIPVAGGPTTMQWVHVAVAENNVTKRSTDEGTIQVVPAVVKVPNVSVAPAKLNFGSVTLGDSATRTVTVTNTGNATLDVTSTAVSGGDAGQFAIQSGGGAGLLAPSASRTITVRFQPTTTGPKSSTLRIASNASGSPAVVQLSGIGQAAPSPPAAGPPPVRRPSTVDVSRSRPDPNSIRFRVRRARANTPVFLDIPEPESEAETGASVSRLAITLTQRSDYELTVRQTRDVPRGTPDLGAGRRNVRSLSYADVGHTVPDRLVDEVTFTVRVRKTRLAASGQSPENIVFFRYAAGSWDELDRVTRQETATHHVLEFGSPGLSVFAIGLREPAIAVTDATLDRTAITAGEAVEVVATLENTGAGNGTFAANLTVDGTVVETRSVEVPAGETRRVTFDRTFPTAGQFDVGVSGVTAGRVTVSEPVTTTAPTPTTTTAPPTPITTTSPPTGPPTTTPGPPGFLPEIRGFARLALIAVVLAVIVVGLYVLYRRREQL